MKECSNCHKIFEDEEFIKDGKELKKCKKCRNYFNSHCKKFRLKNPEYYKKYRLNHKEKYSQKEKQYRINNLEKVREKDKIAQAKYRREHPEEYKEKRLAYQEKNHDKIKAYDKHRMLNRPEYFLFSGARKRARNKKLEFNITEQDIKYLLDNTPICPLRKINFERGINHIPTDNSITLDRIDSTKGYIKDNIQIISHRANNVKQDVNLFLFKIIVEKLKKYKVEEHTIDNDTRKIIIEDRIIKNNIWDHIKIEKRLLASAKKRAKRKQLELNIDENYLKSIWPLDNKCSILGTKFVVGDGYMSPCSATIDRIDNNKGYIKGNIRIISAKVNSVKNNCTLEELEFILKNWEELEKERNNNERL